MGQSGVMSDSANLVTTEIALSARNGCHIF